MNTYNYANVSPLLYTDPEGLAGQAVGGVIALCIRFPGACLTAGAAVGNAVSKTGQYVGQKVGNVWKGYGNNNASESSSKPLPNTSPDDPAKTQQEIGANVGGNDGVAAENCGGDCPPKLDSTGKVHGKIPENIPDSWTDDDLEELGEDLPKSIENRNKEQIERGEDPAHRNRIRQEERLLKQIKKRQSGS